MEKEARIGPINNYPCYAQVWYNRVIKMGVNWGPDILDFF